MPRWTDEEIQYLKENYVDTDIEILAKQLNRSKDAIYIKSNYLGLNKGDTAQKWTEEEVKYLKDNYADVDNETLAKNLNKKIRSVMYKACQFDLKKNKKSKLKIGTRFGRLTILKEVKPITYTTLSKNGKTYISKHEVFLCVCDCGNKKEIRASSLLKGGTQSCGCLRKEKGIENGKKVSSSDGLKKYSKKTLVENTRLDQLNKRKSVSNKSGYKGVCWDKRRKKWEAYIHFKGSKHFLGYFDKKEDAIKARLKAEEEYFVPILEKYKDVFEQ